MIAALSAFILGASVLAEKGGVARVPATKKRLQIQVYTHDDGSLDQGREVTGQIEGMEDAYGAIALVSPKFLREYARDEYLIDTPQVRERSGTVGLLTGIELPADARGQGLGTRLLQEMLVEARQQGARVVYTASERAPRTLYERLGFTSLETTRYGLTWMRLDLNAGAAVERLPTRHTPFNAFISDLPSFLRSPNALRALAHTDVHGSRRSGSAWLRGGCFVLAEALVKFLEAPARAIDVLGPGGVPEHAFVEINGVQVDGRGTLTFSSLETAFPGARGVAPHQTMGWPDADPEDVESLVAALLGRFGKVDTTGSVKNLSVKR